MIDVDLNKFVSSFSMVSYFLDFLRLLRKLSCMALCCNTPSSSSSSWLSLYLPKSKHHSIDTSSFNHRFRSNESLEVESRCNRMCLRQEDAEEGVGDEITFLKFEESPQEIMVQERVGIARREEIGKVMVVSKIRKRPARIVVPEFSSGLESSKVADEPSQKEFEMEGKDYFMASRRGRRDVMEDGYDVIVDIMGDSKQAFFGVFDGHGGPAAVNFVAENLGKKILRALSEAEEGNDPTKEAIRKGYLVTDGEFLRKDVSSGVCAATVLVKDGNLYAANVGDCRVVLSRNGVASALTSDHRVGREDERMRIENSGGYVNCQNGVWRVQGSLAISRAIGDLHSKQWVISEPEINKLELTSDCEFLVIASDGLWDKVSNQEAVDTVLRHKNSNESCKQLVDISFSRGNKDDITVMVVDLQNFKRPKG